MTLRRLTIIAGTLFIFMGLTALLSIDVVVDGVVQRKLSTVEKRLGFPVRVGRAYIDGTDTINLDSVRVGRLAEPLLTIERVVVHLNSDDLRQLKVRPTRVEVRRPTIHLYSDGTWRGLYDVFKELVPQKEASSQYSKVKKESSDRPDVTVVDGRLFDHGGLAHIANGTLDVRGGRVTAHANFMRPKLGRCQVAGDLARVNLSCDEPYAHPLPGDFLIEAKQIEATRKPTPAIRLPGLRVRRVDASASNVIDALFSGLAADVRVELQKNGRTRWPVELKLLLPGGGEVVGRGDAGLDGVDLSASVKNVSFGHAHAGVGGKISGQYSVKVDRRQKIGLVEGTGQLAGFHVAHQSLAEGMIGPMDLSLSGRAEASIVDVSQKWGRLRIEGGRFTMGPIPFDFSADIESRSGAFRIIARCDTDMVSGADLEDAIPTGLLPHLQPLKAEGDIGFNAFLKLDTEKLSDTKFRIKVPKRKFKITSTNDAINFDKLRQGFETRFRVPIEDEEIIELTRMVGPTTARWTSIDDIPPLLPLAIMTQEDGGFYKHGGISMFHLRGSLVDNLKKGRFFRGGSTITMQLARNLFLHRRKTLARKLEEIILAWLLEENFDKDEMMAFYVNVVEFGPDIYGIGEAADHYFQKEPHELTAGEVAWIVRLLPSPRPLYEHFRNGKLSRGHTRSINALLRLLAKRGHLDVNDQTSITPDELWPEGTDDLEKKELKKEL